MQTIPSEWLREKTTVEEIGRDWAARRKKHDWWCPSSVDWVREWESFLRTLNEGGDLVHFSSHSKGWPEGAKEEGYVILRDDVQVRAIHWAGEQSDYSKRT
jgi:hypothetical protein